MNSEKQWAKHQSVKANLKSCKRAMRQVRERKKLRFTITKI